MSTTILPTEIVEDVHDGNRCLRIDLDERRRLFAVEHPYPEWTGQQPFWLVWHQPWVADCLCVDNEETARVALRLLAAAARQNQTASLGQALEIIYRPFANAETPHFVLAKALIEDGWHKGDPA